MISERLKFYADTPRGEPNKYFCFKTDILILEETIKRFLSQGFVLRAAWYEKINTDTGKVLENSRIKDSDIQRLFDEVVASNKKNGFNRSSVTNDQQQGHIDIPPENDSEQANGNPSHYK